MSKKDVYKVLLFLIVVSMILAILVFQKRRKLNCKKSYFEEIELVKIKSTFDSEIQNAYFHKAKNKKRPLLVSLHTWGGTYKQQDSLYNFAIENDRNYIHPDYRGAQWNKNSCCYEQAIKDIDDAISYSIRFGNVDTSKLFLIGKSGGGSGVLAAFLKSGYRNLKCYAWAPIADYVQWHNDVIMDTALKKQYYEKILLGTGSKGSLNIGNARLKSPQYLEVKELSFYSNSSLNIYVGIMDGIKGSTSIKQPIFFYNKLLSSWAVSDSNIYFTIDEINYLYNNRKGIKELGQSIGNRKVIHKESLKNVELTLFEGGHEILLSYMMEELKRNDNNK